MTRNEWEKGKPSRLQLSIGVRHGRDGVLSTPMTEIWEGVRVPEKDGKTELVAPVSTRKGMDLPATCSVTLGSVRVMGVLESGPLQLSRSPRSSGAARLESTP